MLGIGRTVRDGQTLEYELLRLHEDSDGRAVYTALPAGQKEASFVATQVGETTATFENPSHDFPQRTLYSRLDAARMAVQIEGERQGRQRVMEFKFERASCAH